MVRRIKAKLVPGLRDQGLSRNVYCFNVCWAKNLMSKNTEPFPSRGGGAVFLDCDPRRRRPWRSTRGNSGNARSSCM